MTWNAIDTAPKTAPKLYLQFPPQRAYSRTANAVKPTRFDRLGYEVVGRWWTPADVLARVGKKKATTGARGALLARDGGYWGPCKKSKPFEGFPSHWRYLTPEEDLHPDDTSIPQKVS